MEPNEKLGKGCLAVLARTALIRLISVVAVLLLAAFSCVIGSMIGSMTEGIWGLISGTVFFAVVLFGGGFGYAFFTVYRRKLYLDKAFEPLGLKGSIYRLVFRRYQGRFQGRDVELYFSRGPTVEIIIPTKLKTRLGITPNYGDTMFFSRLMNTKPLTHNVENLKNLSFWSEDAEWSGNLVSDPSVQQRILRTVAGQTFFVRSFIKFFPDHLQIHFSGNTNIFSWEIPPEQARQWFEDAFAIVQHAETRVPLPHNPIEMTSAENLALRIRRKDTTKISIILAVSMLLFFAFVFIVSVLFVSLAG